MPGEKEGGVGRASLDLPQGEAVKVHDVRPGLHQVSEFEPKIRTVDSVTIRKKLNSKGLRTVANCQPIQRAAERSLALNLLRLVSRKVSIG